MQLVGVEGGCWFGGGGGGGTGSGGVGVEVVVAVLIEVKRSPRQQLGQGSLHYFFAILLGNRPVKSAGGQRVGEREYQ